MMTKERCKSLFLRFKWKKHYCRSCKEWVKGQACKNKKSVKEFNRIRHLTFCKIAEIDVMLKRIKKEDSFEFY